MEGIIPRLMQEVGQEGLPGATREDNACASDRLRRLIRFPPSMASREMLHEKAVISASKGRLA